MAQKATNGYSKAMSCEEVKIPVPWGHIAAKWWGSQETQPVIAIHGWQDNAGTFDNLAPLLVKEGISVLCLDLPGHGLSSYYPQGLFYYIFWDGLHLLRRVVKHYNWSKVKVLGHSLGGAIAFLYASVYPDEIESYISLDIASPAVRDVSKHLNKTQDIIEKFLKYENLSKDKLPCYGYSEMLGIVHAAYQGACTMESCEILMQRGMQPVGNGLYTFSRDPRLKVGGLALMDIQQVLDMAKLIRCRVMNIRANPGMKWEKPEYYEMALEEIGKNASCLERHTVEGTHHVHLNNAERVAGFVVEFFKK